MKTYVVAFIDFFENVLKLTKIEAEDEVEAAKRYLGTEVWELREGATLEDIQDTCFNCDCCINVIEV